MEQPGISRRLLLQELNAAFANPTPDLADQQRNEHDQKPASKFASEDGHGQTCLCDGEPSALV
jgi:hypothetical protein